MFLIASHPRCTFAIAVDDCFDFNAIRREEAWLFEGAVSCFEGTCFA